MYLLLFHSCFSGEKDRGQEDHKNTFSPTKMLARWEAFGERPWGGGPIGNHGGPGGQVKDPILEKVW